MEFKEFEKKFKGFKDDHYEVWIHGIPFQVYDDGGGLYVMSTYNEHIVSIVTKGQNGLEVIIGKYSTLKEAYEALKEICKLNKVEME